MLKTLVITIAILFFSLNTNSANAQILDKVGSVIKKGAEKLNKGMNKVLYGKGTGKVNSEIRNNDFFQLPTIPQKDTNNTRFPIANNLFIDIKGKYPFGYQPKWRFLSYNSPLTFKVENWVVPSSGLHSEEKNISIGDYNGKAVLRFGAYFTCDCFADIEIKDSIALITSSSQTFKVTNFRKILNERSTGEHCGGSGNNTYTDGGWEGKITLTANENGDITMNLMIENYTVGYQPSFQKAYIPSQVSYRYIANGITIENEMSAKRANEKIAAELEAKQKQKDYLVKTIKQADSLKKLIAKKFPSADCRNCYARNQNHNLQITPTKTAYTNGYGDVYIKSGTDWDINTKTEIKNKCNYILVFIGIQQLHNDQKGYYLGLVTKEMPAGYHYNAEQGIVSSLFTAFLGGGSEFNFEIQDKYYPESASVGYVQWIKVVRKK